MHRFDRSRRALAFAIAGLAGFVDATGYLAADQYFVSFTSGNSTRLGVDIATEPARAFIPALLIGGFVTGVTLGALVAEAAEARRKTMVVGLSAALLVLAAGARVAGLPAPFMACAVLAMGVLNNAFLRAGEVAVGLTYMTGALVLFEQGLASAIRGKAREDWLANLGLWCSLAAGAVGGAFASTQGGALAAMLAAGLAAGLFVAALAIERRGAPQSS